MADQKIADLDTLTPVANNDWVPVVDVSDTTDGPDGTTKKAARSDFKGDKGDTGEKGDTGSAGAAGSNGTNGTNGTNGSDGNDGTSAFVYIAYASDGSGTGFTLTFNASLDYIAILSTDTEIVSPAVGDFAGLWKNYKGATGATGAQGPQGDAGSGSGDMLAATYDPNSVADDAFAMDNMVEGTNTKILTSAERTKLSNTTGTNSGDQTVTLTGDVTGSGTGSFAATIAAGAVTLAKMANMATASLIYRKTAGSGAPEVNTLATLKSDLGLTGTNSGDQTSVTGNAGTATALQTARTIDGQSFDGTGNITVIAPGTHAATGKTTPVDADELPLVDSAASNVLKKLTWANLKATLKTYFDTLYQAAGSYITASSTDTLTNKTLTQPKFTDLGFIADTAGNEFVRFDAVSSAVNQIDISNNSAGLAPFIRSSGDDTNIDLNLLGKGTGIIYANSVPVVTTTGTQTLTNKRITKRTGTTTSSATPTINTDNVDFYSITALAAAITSFTTNLSGTPTEGQTLWIVITDNGTARAITWGASFEASTVALPTTTVISTRLDVGFVWNTSKWRCIASA